MNELDAELILINKEHEETATVFLALCKDYLNDLDNIPTDITDRLPQSMLDCQGEPDRWLLLVRGKDDYIGFTHFKIDREERPGWGFICEFYIVPRYRRQGWGSWLYKRALEKLVDEGAGSVWLTASRTGTGFWRAVGFEETGAVAGNGLDVMISSKEL